MEFNRCSTLHFLTVLILFAAGSANAQESLKWVLRKDQDSIRVFVADDPAVAIKQIRAEFTLRAKPEELISELLRADLYREWQYNTVKSEILETISPTELVYYCEISAPWPVDNRDVIVHLKVDRPAGAKTFAVRTYCLPDARPERDGVVRVPVSRGDWNVRQVGPEMLKVDFRIQIDPGGSVPAWLVNLTLAQAPFQSFSALRKRLSLNRK